MTGGPGVGKTTIVNGLHQHDVDHGRLVDDQ